MKALTLTQPWATLVAIGAKRIETRSWKTNYTGLLAIHASKNFPLSARNLCNEDPFRSALLVRNADPAKHTGMIIATCVLVNVIPTVCAYANDAERSFGDFTPGRYAWILEDVRPLSDPIHARGSLGLWEWIPSNDSTWFIDRNIWK